MKAHKHTYSTATYIVSSHKYTCTYIEKYKYILGMYIRTYILGMYIRMYIHISNLPVIGLTSTMMLKECFFSKISPINQNV